MDEQQTASPRTHRAGGRDAKRAARAARTGVSMPYITRKIGLYEVLDEEGLATIERNADTILAEIGIEFRDDPGGDRVLEGGRRRDRRRARALSARHVPQLVEATAPRDFIQHARNPARSVLIGGKHTVFAPAYGSPFVRNLDEGRRYATIEDFRNFVKLAYMAPSLHHSGGTICEPVDLPVNKRHFDMVYSHMKYSDKPFMGSVTHPERAQDSVEMAKILFGDQYHRSRHGQAQDGDHQPHQRQLADDLRRHDARRARRSTRATIRRRSSRRSSSQERCRRSPSPARPRRRSPRPSSGMAFVQLVAPGAPVVLGSFASSISMQSGAPTFGTPEPALVLFVMAALARRLGVPFRSGGALCGSKIADAQAAYESANTLLPTCLGGVNFVLHTAGWLEGGLAMGYEKFVMDVDQAGMMHTLLAGRGSVRERPGDGCDPRRRSRQALPRLRAHAGEFRDRVLPLADRRQQQLRAMGSRRQPGPRAARQRELEEAAREL